MWSDDLPLEERAVRQETYRKTGCILLAAGALDVLQSRFTGSLVLESLPLDPLLAYIIDVGMIATGTLSVAYSFGYETTTKHI